MTILSTTSLFKSYADNPVLKDISLSLEKGHFYLLVGVNGSGKSTLMRVLTAQEGFDAGDASLLGKSLQGDVSTCKRHVGYVSETIDYALPGPLKKIAELQSKLYPEWNQKQFDQLAAELGMDLLKTFAELSRGQKMQFCFAIARCIQPKLLILDEITSVLDAKARSIVMGNLAAFMRQGGTVVLVTNIVSEAHGYADQMLILDDGRIALETSVRDLPERFQKVRKKPEDSHPVFDDPDCRPLQGSLDDGSVIYLLPTSGISRFTDLGDRRLEERISAEDAFIYFTRKRVG